MRALEHTLALALALAGPAPSGFVMLHRVEKEQGRQGGSGNPEALGRGPEMDRRAPGGQPALGWAETGVSTRP